MMFLAILSMLLRIKVKPVASDEENKKSQHKLCQNKECTDKHMLITYTNLKGAIWDYDLPQKKKHVKKQATLDRLALESCKAPDLLQKL